MAQLVELSRLVAALGLGDTLEEQLLGLSNILQQENSERASSDIKSSDEYRELLRERDELQRRADEETILSDLRRLRDEYPTHRFESVEDLGEVFCLLRVLGLDCVSAYYLIQELEKRSVPRIGQVSVSKKGEDYYTEDELKSLTKTELAKPGVLERALRSLVRRQ